MRQYIQCILGKLRGRKGHDQTDQNQNHGHCNLDYGGQFCFHASSVYWAHASHWRLGISCSLLPLWRENPSRTGVGLFQSIAVI